MGFTALHVLWFLLAFKLITPELVKLSVSPSITAECDKQVTLNCIISSSQDGLSIMHMGWSHGKTLCAVNSTGAINIHYNNLLSDFHCEHKNGQLSLIFQKVNPLEIGNYSCRIHSNMGAQTVRTRMDLKECFGSVLTSSGPTCTFSRVYPDGDVHWFHGNLSAESLRHNTSKSIDKHGWMTIHSSLTGAYSPVPYNCSLRSTISDRYITSTQVYNQISHELRGWQHTTSSNYGVRSQDSTKTILCMLIFLPVTLK